MVKGKKILLCVTGSIAAYKSALLVRLLIKEGAEVKIIMTNAATDFITPLTLSTLSKNDVLTDLVTGNSWANHVMLGRWADVLLIAPLSCNTLSKMAAGSCNNLLMAVYLSATCKVVVAPAMDEDMWLHPSTKRNLVTLQSFGNEIIPIENGELASGLFGEGRMAEPATIVSWLDDFFTTDQPLKGKNALITAGPTYEHIDPVRFIGNYSSGKMGIAIAEELKNKGAAVTVVLGPSAIRPSDDINTIHVNSAEEMYLACMNLYHQMDIMVMSAAVADYTPQQNFAQKIKKTSEHLTIDLVPTKDILKELGRLKTDKQILVGFALETTDETTNARKKLAEKKADIIVLNSLNDEGAGFGYDTNKVTIFKKGGEVHHFDMKTKAAVAKDIVNAIIQL